MATGRRDDGTGAGHRPGAAGSAGSAAVLPIVRAAMACGDGPPAVLAWVRRQGAARPRAQAWTDGDEARARVLAARLAVRLRGRARAGAETGWAGATAGAAG